METSALFDDPPNRSAVVILSGGMDSAVLLYLLHSRGYDLKALTFNYGQKHSKEIEYAAGLCRLLSVEQRIVDISVLQPLFGASALTSAAATIPSGHYTEDQMKVTVVPNRNMIMLSIAAAWAFALNFSAVAYAAHAGDHAIYPDCRKEFGDAMEKAFQLADWSALRLLRPFVGSTKAQICGLGIQLGVDFEGTWSCYRGGEVHCGSCGTCVERKEAFELTGVTDPTRYQIRA